MPSLKQLIIAYWNVWLRARVDPSKYVYGFLVSGVGVFVAVLLLTIFFGFLQLYSSIYSIPLYLLSLILGFLTMCWVAYQLVMGGHI